MGLPLYKTIKVAEGFCSFFEDNSLYRFLLVRHCGLDSHSRIIKKGGQVRNDENGKIHI